MKVTVLNVAGCGNGSGGLPGQPQLGNSPVPVRSLVYIVLILADSDRFWVDLYQFCQRVHEPPADGYRSADCHILIGKLFPCYLGRRINGGATLVDHHHQNLLREIETANKSLCLPSCCAIPYGNGLYVELLTHLEDP